MSSEEVMREQIAEILTIDNPNGGDDHVNKLTGKIAALMDERTNILATKREQITLLESKLIKATAQMQGLVESERFWREEYKRLAQAGVERMADYGVVCDPAEKMVEAAEYRLKKHLERQALATLDAGGK